MKNAGAEAQLLAFSDSLCKYIGEQMVAGNVPLSVNVVRDTIMHIAVEDVNQQIEKERVRIN